MLETPIQSVPAAEVAGKTLVEEYMAMSYEFRRNVLSDKYEMREVCNDNDVAQADGRPIFGKAQRSRKRYASFVATTNNPRPLQDTTGSRRYLCVEIPQDTIILNDHPIDYDQLYAQVLYEIREQHLSYWFTPAETRRIEEMNVKFQHVNDLESMVTTCFRRPEAEEIALPMLTRDVVNVLAKNFPDLKPNHGTDIKVGMILKHLNFERKECNRGTVYYIVPLTKTA